MHTTVNVHTARFALCPFPPPPPCTQTLSSDDSYLTNIPGGASKKVKTEPKVDPEVAQALEKQSKMIWKIRDKLHRECRYVCHRVMF